MRLLLKTVFPNPAISGKQCLQSEADGIEMMLLSHDNNNNVYIQLVINQGVTPPPYNSSSITSIIQSDKLESFNSIITNYITQRLLPDSVQKILNPFQHGGSSVHCPAGEVCRRPMRASVIYRIGEIQHGNQQDKVCRPG